jgi:hypothetical protein
VSRWESGRVQCRAVDLQSWAAVLGARWELTTSSLREAAHDAIECMTDDELVAVLALRRVDADPVGLTDQQLAHCLRAPAEMEAIDRLIARVHAQCDEADALLREVNQLGGAS